jgi:hypothetical protein
MDLFVHDRRLFVTAQASVRHIKIRTSPRPAAYTFAMARGWESKSIEAQQAEAAETARVPKKRLTPEKASRQRELDGVQLSRKRVLRQLAPPPTLAIARCCKPLWLN